MPWNIFNPANTCSLSPLGTIMCVKFSKLHPLHFLRTNIWSSHKIHLASHTRSKPWKYITIFVSYHHCKQSMGIRNQKHLRLRILETESVLRGFMHRCFEMANVRSQCGLIQRGMHKHNSSGACHTFSNLPTTIKCNWECVFHFCSKKSYNRYGRTQSQGVTLLSRQEQPNQ